MSKYDCPLVCLLVLIATAILGRSGNAESESDEKTVLHVSAHLRDGSHLLGTVKHPHVIPLHTGFGRASVPLELVSLIQILEDQERVQVSFRNGDRLSGVLEIHAVKLKTSVGEITIPFPVLTRIEVAGVARHGLLPPSSHCVDFTGGGCIALGLPPDVLNGPAATYEAWIQPRDATHEGIFIWDGNDRGGFDRIFYYSRGRLKVFFQFDPSTRLAPHALIPIKTWTHVAYVISGDTLTTYVNGDRVGKVASRVARHQSTSGLAIGQGVHQGRPYMSQFFGKMTDVKVWSRALSADEIRRSARGERLDGTGLLGHWDFANNSLAPRAGITNHPVRYGNARIVPVSRNEQASAAIGADPREEPIVFNGYMFHEFGGHYYTLTKATDWEGSEAEAVSLGGHLVAINSEEEQGFVNRTFLAGRSSQDADTHRWIGLTDRGTEGQFEWTTGESLEFQFWDNGEPNNSGDEDYVFTNWGPVLGRWNDSTNDANVGGGIIELSFDPAMIQRSSERERANSQ